MTKKRSIAVGFFVLSLVGFNPVIGFSANSVASVSGPAALETDNLTMPLGIDDSTPRFSWQLRDDRFGARQSAYEIQVATRGELLNSGKADVWDSGQIVSEQSTGVTYNGIALKASTRYYWRVLAWDRDGKPYPLSEVSWWETGLLSGSWRGDWIGYENWDEAAVRLAGARYVTSPDGKKLADKKTTEQKIAYRLLFKVDASISHAVLYVTGQDVASAWINGSNVLTGAPLPPWKQLPWKKYVKADVTSQLHAGQNELAVETTRYVDNPADPGTDIPPMSATLLVQHRDGSIAHFVSGVDMGWKASISPAEGWEKHSEKAGVEADTSWKPVIHFVPGSDDVAGEDPGKPWPTESVKEVRQEFEVPKKVVSARLYATAFGAYQVFVNGKRAGDQVLSPGWTDYRLRFKYQTYDVTSYLIKGKNALAALIAPGWYSTPLMWFQQPNVYGSAPPSLRAELRLEYSDGTVDWVASDASWKASPSPTLKAEIYDGETQDARLAQPGWNTARFDAKSWKTAEVHALGVENAEAKIDGQDFQPIRVERELTPKAVTEPKPGTYIYDMGQNFSGVERLHLRGPAGTDVQVRTGEVLNDDGTLYTENLRTAKSTDHFILAGKGVEEFQPQFTFHGFRYLELTGLSGKPLADAVRGVVFHTDAQFAAQLKTGSPLINSLWSNILWGQRSNFVGVPTDCPQRDERLGWAADAQVFWRTATYNMDLAAFSRKFSADLRGTQVGSGKGDTAGKLFGIFAPGVTTISSGSAAGWSDAGVIIPWTSWVQTGDRQVLEQNWDAMTKYTGMIEQTNPDFLWTKNAGIGFGDWLAPEGETRFALVATASWAYDVTLMQQMAHAMGKTEEEAHYAELFKHIQAAFTREFVHEDGYVAGANQDSEKAKAGVGDTQTGYVLALYMRLVPDRMRAAVAEKLVGKIEGNRGLLGTGFLGTPYLLAVLTDTGHQDVAYKLLLNTNYPSWGYLVDHGATTMWERWNGDAMRKDPGMNSYNHYAYGAVADWIYRYAAGVDTTPVDAGFHTVMLHPTFDSQLGSIDFTYPSPYGEIHSAWTVKQGSAHWDLTIPANATGWLPLNSTEAAKYRVEGSPITESKLLEAASKDGIPGFNLPAGKYIFDVSGVQ